MFAQLQLKIPIEKPLLSELLTFNIKVLTYRDVDFIALNLSHKMLLCLRENKQTNKTNPCHITLSVILRVTEITLAHRISLFSTQPPFWNMPLC